MIPPPVLGCGKRTGFAVLFDVKMHEPPKAGRK
jgi:hypothetical protein